MEESSTVSSEALSAFAADLAALRERAGSPTLEQLSQRTGVSKSVISEAFAGRRLPTENTVRKLVAALDDDANVMAWVERRSGIDPRHVDRLPTADGSVPAKRVGFWRRPVSVATFVAGMAATAVVAIAASLLATGLVGRTDAPAAAPTPSTSYEAYADGVDPMLTECREDAVLAGGDEFLDGKVLVEMMYSNKCMAVWGRVTRYDGQGSGNTITMRIYPRKDPESTRSQSRTDSDVQSLYTPLLIEPDVEARVCGVATVTVGDQSFVQPNPVCI